MNRLQAGESPITTDQVREALEDALVAFATQWRFGPVIAGPEPHRL